jgi:hypothetical protein
VKFCDTPANGLLSSHLGRVRAIEQPLAFAVEIAQVVGLEPIGENTK